ncbi:MAG: hypothetical protein O7G83_15155 [Proteobacteria bacterium]|nr:hypothetical protein [Pseudomonadota bacterium]
MNVRDASFSRVLRAIAAKGGFALDIAGQLDSKVSASFESTDRSGSSPHRRPVELHYRADPVDRCGRPASHWQALHLRARRTGARQDLRRAGHQAHHTSQVARGQSQAWQVKRNQEQALSGLIFAAFLGVTIVASCSPFILRTRAAAVCPWDGCR